MKINTFIKGFVLMAVALATACTEETYTPAESEAGAGVHFSRDLAQNVTLVSGQSSITVPVLRADKEGALTVAVKSTQSQPLFSIPSSVSFAAGSERADLELTFDPEAIEYDESYTVQLSLSDEVNVTAYGKTEVTLTLMMPAPWVSLGMATYVDDFVTTFYGVDNVPYEVEIQENQVNPGFYRLVNPYGEAYPYNDPGDWDDSRDYYLEIHAEDPTAVYIETQGMGCDWGYGEFIVSSIAGYYMANGQSLADVKAAGYTGTLEDGVISFPAEVLLFGMSEYGGGGLYTSNGNGAFKVAMPGIVLKDYGVEVSYAGKYMNAKDEPAGVMANITAVGADVESVLVAMVEGNDVAAAVEGIIDGSIEAVSAAGEGTVLIPFETEPEAGRCTIVAVAFADGEAQGYGTASFKYTPSDSVPETWTLVGTGDFEYTLFFGEEDDPAVDEGLELFRSDTDPTRYKIGEWGFGVDFVFSYDAGTGEVLVEEQETGYVHPQYGTVFVDDLVDYVGDASMGESFFEDGVFYFALIYFDADDYWNYGYETFSLNDAPASAPVRAAAAPAAPKKVSAASRDIKKIPNPKAVAIL